MDFAFIVLGWYSDGSLMGPSTVVATFRTQTAADRFVALAKTLSPSKELAVVVAEIER